MAQGVMGFFQALVWLIWNVGLFWVRRLWHWYTTKSQKELLIETLQTAHKWEEWQAAAMNLDELGMYFRISCDVHADEIALDNNRWRRLAFEGTYNSDGSSGPNNIYYDSDLVELRTNQFEDAVNEEAIMTIHGLLRAGLTRNPGGILNPKLYSKANAGTKLLIEAYVKYASDAVKLYAQWPLTPELPLTAQAKLDTLHDTRMAYGRTVLVLQGGSIFGLCHLGVVKAMYQRKLLPRIIAGSATGALMAAWVGVHTEEELFNKLSGDKIDLSAFVASSQRAAAEAHGEGSWLWMQTLYRRARRFLRSGFILDPNVLEEAVRANVGEMTFQEAYNRTKRILNITISPSGPGSITLLNYITAPHVLIWSAALVSNANDRSQTSIELLCKTEIGIVPYEHYSPGPRPLKSMPATAKESPLARLGELFNVDHFIISQARPYIAPFLYPSSLRVFRTSLFTRFTRFIMQEIQHRLRQLDIMGALSPGVKRLLMDEIVPGPALTLVPEIRWADWARLLRNPTKQEIDHWIERGERSVWPHVMQLWIRLGVEFELEDAYQRARRRNAGGFEVEVRDIEEPLVRSRRIS